jgi:hypothetical protein
MNRKHVVPLSFVVLVVMFFVGTTIAQDAQANHSGEHRKCLKELEKLPPATDSESTLERDEKARECEDIFEEDTEPDPD